MSHYEYVTKVNEEAKKKVEECDRMLEILNPLLSDMNTCIKNADTDFASVKKIIELSAPEGSGDYYDKYTESRDKWIERYNGMATDAGTTSSNLEKVINDINNIKTEWEPKVYYTVYEEVED